MTDTSEGFVFIHERAVAMETLAIKVTQLCVSYYRLGAKMLDLKTVLGLLGFYPLPPPPKPGSMM
jgi:hypothetical protein